MSYTLINIYHGAIITGRADWPLTFATAHAAAHYAAARGLTDVTPYAFNGAVL